MSQRKGAIQQKILLLLLGGFSLSLSHSPKTSFKIIKAIGENWKEIEKRALRRAIKSLYESKFIKAKYNKKKDAVTVVLTQDGKKKAITYKIFEEKIKKPKKWDGKWRIVLFDIPEWRKKDRDAFRLHLKHLEFYEFQKSVFVHPYDCRNEIDYIIETLNIREHVRFIVADTLDNELHLKQHFRLL